jgi:hypothetical protein
MLNRNGRTSKFLSFVISAASVVLTLCLSATGFAQSMSGTFTSFDAPGAGTGSGQGTFPVAIDRDGLIGGYMMDSTNTPHGFLRSSNGVFTAVNPPSSTRSQINAINSLGQAVGTFDTPNRQTHAFLRGTNGNYRLLDVPGYFLTIPKSINDNGQVTGSVDDHNNGSHGFLWDAQSGFTIFDVPGFTGATQVAAINASGEVTGSYIDTLLFTHGFIRDASGNITTFDASSGGRATVPYAINASGEITGSWDTGSGFQFGFLRNAKGMPFLFFSTQDFTVGASINDGGIIVGYTFTDFGSASFEVGRPLNVTTINLPFANNSNTAVSINAAKHVTGVYTDLVGVNHGWVH